MPRQPPPFDLKPYFRTLDDLERPFSWRQFFENDHPIEIDVGSGRGLFLVTAGIAHPQRNYLGVEIDYREGRRASGRLSKRGMDNVRVLGGNAREFLANNVPPESVTAVHVYFPDPWWKKKHHKRRIFTDEFANLVTQVLEPNGLLHHWTDVSDYFDVVRSLMDHHPAFETLAPPAEQSPEHDMDYRTSFERKKRKAGLPIYRGLWQKRSQ